MIALELKHAALTEPPGVAIDRREHRIGFGRIRALDETQRFDLLSQAALEYARAASADRPWDVIHLHDWQTGTAGLRLLLEDRWGDLRRAGIVFTIHNLAYQGTFAKDVVPSLGLPWSAFRLELGEFWGQFSFLKSGISSADCVTTVSPTYAEETRTPAAGVER